MYTVFGVLPDAIEKQCHIRGRSGLLDDSRVTESNKRITFRVFRTHTRGDIVLSPHGNVGLQFSIDLTVDAGACEQTCDSAVEGHCVTSRTTMQRTRAGEGLQDQMVKGSMRIGPWHC